jgi:8-oxo-dGTP pyrophosphatase MutT (NUDIX family)
MAERLLRWRRECERGFCYVELQLMPEAVRREAEEEARLSAAQLLQQALACEAQWNRGRLAYVRELEGLQAQYWEACLVRACLGAKLRAIG